ncbi:MAG TPA: helix-turn-helix domain-containing protein [Anaerolineae bacterium]|nr:helix-turn-helix domain-containing protein [Anaerolineae bacterium]
MSEQIGQLRELGFSEYEARAYLALLHTSPMNGYEVAKAAGLPRANVYGVLQKLEDRGAIVRVDAPEGTRYAPVPSDELVRQLHDRYEETLQAARAGLRAASRPPEYEYVANVRGAPALLDHAGALIDAAREHLQVALWPPESMSLAENLAGAQARGVAITTLCLAACAQECGRCRGEIHRYSVQPDDSARWLVIVADGGEVLTGQMGPGQEAQAIRTRQHLLVDLSAGFIRHSIALATLLEDLGGRLPALLKPETRAILASAGPGGQRGDWLEYMSQLMQSGQKQDPS